MKEELIEKYLLNERDGELFVFIGEIEDVIQRKIGGNFNTEHREEEVALFTSEKKAHAYAKKYKLKKPKRHSYAGTEIFKSKSPLAIYSSYRVEKYHKVELPVDPT